MEDKILQIIPAPADMWVKSKFVDLDDECKEKPCLDRVVCLALVEGESGYREVKAMIMCSDTKADFADEIDTYGTKGTWREEKSNGKT